MEENQGWDPQMEETENIVIITRVPAMGGWKKELGWLHESQNP